MGWLSRILKGRRAVREEEAEKREEFLSNLKKSGSVCSCEMPNIVTARTLTFLELVRGSSLKPSPPPPPEWDEDFNLKSSFHAEAGEFIEKLQGASRRLKDKKVNATISAITELAFPGSYFRGDSTHVTCSSGVQDFVTYSRGGQDFVFTKKRACLNCGTCLGWKGLKHVTDDPVADIKDILERDRVNTERAKEICGE